MSSLREKIELAKLTKPNKYRQIPKPTEPTETTEPISHGAILDRLLNELRPIDLGDSSSRVKTVLTVETILQTAKANHWQLCRNNGTTYVYNGQYWQQLEPERLEVFLGQAAEMLGVPPIAAKFFRFRQDLVRQFETSAILPTPTPQPDKVHINLLNGTFEFSPSGTTLKPFDPADFIAYQLLFKYDPTATSPIFQAYLDRVLPDPDRQKVLAEFVGYVFIRHGSRLLKEEKALILYGTGANGKSIFFEVITALLGHENVSHFSLASLTEEKGFYRSQIEHKLLNYCSEISNRLEAAMFKNLVSGEPVEVSHKYGQPYTMRNYAKLVFNSNELPKDVEHSHAFFRRFLIIPFDQTIPDDQQDKRLHSKIIENELAVSTPPTPSFLAIAACLPLGAKNGCNEHSQVGSNVCQGR
jgi:putative DNA primase/helicase